MGIIVDNCVAWTLVSVPVSLDARQVLDFLLTRGRLIYGGKLAKELSGNVRLGALILELTRAGRVQRVAESAIAKLQDELERSGLLVSNDGHVIALALASGVHLVYTSDDNLCHDVKNKRLLDNPRGKVYKKASHRALLRNSRRATPVFTFSG